MSGREVPVVFVLETTAAEGHPHSDYTHRCDVNLFGRTMWTMWGRSAEEATRNGEREIASRLRVLRGY